MEGREVKKMDRPLDTNEEIFRKFMRARREVSLTFSLSFPSTSMICSVFVPYAF